MTDDETVSASEHSFFEEREEVLSILQNNIACESPEMKNLDSSVERVVKIIEKYQEQSSLLDPHLEIIMSILTSRSRAMMSVVYDKQRASQGDVFPFQWEKNPQQHAIFQIVYNLCRCRGFKTIVKFFPHEVSDLEPLMCVLQSQDRSDSSTWESRYALLLWLSMIVLVPFDIYTIDSSAAAAASKSYGGDHTLVGSILSMCREYMCDSGPTQAAAAVCLSSLLTRPDMDESYFLQFVAWAGALLSEGDLFQSSRKVLLVTGVLMTLTAIFKKGHRSHLLGVIEHLFPHIIHLARQSSSSSVLRKLIVKLVQRIGMAFLPPRVVSWAYQRGQRSLLQNLAGGASSSGATGGPEGGSADEGGDVWVPEELEDIVEQLLIGLRDRDTVVRWSAAKGIGRITSRLPRAHGDDVVASVLELFSESEGDGAWHGGCLAVAELARRGLLLPERLPEAVPFVCTALLYDVRRGSNSVGAHVRDAACYVCWAFARAYSPAVMAQHVDKLCDGMLLAALFDREINVRRAAAAAFQENVGRQGHQNFPHGIDILTAADYFTLGVRSNAYLKISLFVAGFSKYRKAIMMHVHEVKLCHWDIEVRDLSARALGLLAALDPAHVAAVALPSLLPNTTSPDLLKRHGSILGVAECLLALARLKYPLPEAMVDEIIAVVPQLEKARLYRGRGSEIVRQAACRLIECIASADLPLPVKMQLRLLDSIDESIKHSMEPVQLQAVAALRCFTKRYFPVAEGGPSPRLQARILDKYVEVVLNADIASSTRGFALALGALPARLLSGANLTLVLDTLRTAAWRDRKVGEEPDIETRRNALTAMVEVCETMGLGGAGLTPAQFQGVAETLLEALCDYSLDKRGDVGSWARVAAMAGLEKLASLAFPATRAPTEAEPPAPPEADLSASASSGAEAFFTAALAHRVVESVLKQWCEKLDNVRSKAGTVLVSLMESRLPGVPCRAELEAIFLGGGAVNWSVAAETFQRAVTILAFAPYHDSIVAGLVLSVGGLTESVVKSSSAALIEYVKRGSPEAVAKLVESLVSLFGLHKGDDRVILPLMKTFEVLLHSGVLNSQREALGSAFGDSLVLTIKPELARSTSIVKLFAGINIALALLPLRAGPGEALKLILELLGHRYPRVRKQVAEQFYNSLLVDDRLVDPEVYDLVLEQLTSTVWDADLSAVRTDRDAIAAAVGVKVEFVEAAVVETKAKKDVLDTYQNLVNEVGY